MLNYKINTEYLIKKINSQCQQILTLNVKSTRTQFGQMKAQYHIKRETKSINRINEP